MRRHVTIVVFLGSLAVTAAAQSGAEITMPPDSKQEGLFPFSNSCPSSQTYRVSVQPEAKWLRFEPPAVNVGPDTSFAVRVTANTSGIRNPGTYRTSLRVVCASCSASDPPCLQDAREFPISLTIANVGSPGEFQPTAAPPAPPRATPESTPRLPLALISPDPPRAASLRWIPVVGFGLLVAGSIALVLAVRALSTAGDTAHKLVATQTRIVAPDASPARMTALGQSAPESQRHQVRR
jgi:hypothetical protein